MKKNEILTFIILSFNFLITGFVVERDGLLGNNYIFVAFVFLGAFALTKYVFRISNSMRKGGKK